MKEFEAEVVGGGPLSQRVRISVSRSGACRDNAAAESFFAALKTRCITGGLPQPGPREVRRRQPVGHARLHLGRTCDPALF